MSDRAFQLYAQAHEAQNTRNQARHIRKCVSQARSSPHTAGLRWPFELLQNALDPGPRPGSSCVRITLRRRDDSVVFEHDGLPFSSTELAALLSGGSSKDFESENTTGRFGTGFLVTHVLAERTSIRGVLAVGPDHEHFELVLDRGGDEKTILDNIYACSDAIKGATPVATMDRVPSATFEYFVDSVEPLRIGLESFRQSLPYLFGTRSNLGPVIIESSDGEIEEWVPSPPGCEEANGGIVHYRNISVVIGRKPPIDLRVLRFMTRRGAHVAALLLVRKQASGWKIEVPEADRPRIYREYPLRNTGFLPINFILDGKFDPDEERSRLLMTDNDKLLVQESLEAAILGIRRAAEARWQDAHLLARATLPKSAYVSSAADEKEWWTNQLTSFAVRVAELPIVDTGDQMLPAISEKAPFADFVVPRLTATSSSDETTIERLWPLVQAAATLLPARLEIAADWTATALGWSALGLSLNLITVERLAQEVRPDVPLLNELKVKQNKREWITALVDVIGECWESRSGHDESILEGLLPDQSGHLSSPERLKQDGGVSNALKHICKSIGLDVRCSLLDRYLLKCGRQLGLKCIVAAVNKVVPTTVSESDIVDECLAFLDDKLPENSGYEPSAEQFFHGSIRLLDYLFRTQGTTAESVAKRIALVVSDNRIVRWNRDRMLMAPTRNWHISAQPFASAYPPDRILADEYAGIGESNTPDVSQALAAWGIVYIDPIASNTPAELRTCKSITYRIALCFSAGGFRSSIHHGRRWV
jgi:hypothetical protein